MHLLDLFPAHIPTLPTAADWAAHWPQLTQAHADPFALAIAAGASADRLAWAFGGGYQAALRAAFPGPWAPDDTASLCVTEPQGNRPRDIATTLQQHATQGLCLSGHKRWSTMSPVATRLYVLARCASEGTAVAAADPRPQLKIVRVSPLAAGVHIAPMPATAFTPELPHAELTLQDVTVTPADLLPGDGWSDHAKPFRTREDLYVSAACTAYLVRVGLAARWPEPLVEDGLAALAALQGLSTQAPMACGTHLALTGILRQLSALHAAIDAHLARHPDDAAATTWSRDRQLFGLSRPARVLRTERAWAQLRGGGGSAAR